MTTTQNLTAISPLMFSRMVSALDKRRAANGGGMFALSDATVFVPTGGDRFTAVTRLGIHNK